MLSFQFNSLCSWCFLVLVSENIKIVKTEGVIEVNEEDLDDHGININLSDLDTLLPVVVPKRLTTTFQISRQRDTKERSEEQHKSGGQTQRTFENSILKFEKQLVNASQNILKEELEKKLNNYTAGNKIQKQKDVFSETEEMKKEKQKDVFSEVKPNIIKLSEKFQKNTHHRIKLKANIRKDLLNNKNIASRKKTDSNSNSVYHKNTYYNIYDVDKPVTIKKEHKSISKDKQEMVNNTLALYGLHLDSKGETIILKKDSDLKQNSGTKEEKNHKGGQELRKDSSGKKMEQDERYYLNKSDKENKKYQMKPKKQNTIKSLWNIFKTVSSNWK